MADLANNRVVAYPDAATAADLVLGQTAFNQIGINIIKPNSLYFPAAVAIDTSSTPNHFYLADAGNSRVLGWNSLPASNVAGPPDLVIGQSSSSAGGCNQNRVDAANNPVAAADTLCAPSGVAVDPAGNLYVADSANFRVLEYNTPFASGKSAGLSANLVLGQSGSFTSRVENNGGVSAASMSQPGGIAVDPAAHLYVSDPLNNRVLEYDHPTLDTNAEAVFGQGGDLTASTCNFDGFCDRAGCFASADALCGPAAVSVDSSGKLYIADTANNRVLVFNTPRSATADIVIGQPDFLGLTCGTLCSPNGLAVDPAGDLFTADSTNSIVDRYTAPLRNGIPPQTVFGHALCDQFSSTDDSLCGPSGLAFGPTGFLYVSDTFNNRVLVFPVPPTPTSTATPTPTLRPTPTQTPRPTPTAAPVPPSISSIPRVILVGGVFTIKGAGFTHGSQVNFFVATNPGSINTGPFKPLTVAPGLLTVDVPVSNPLGQGVVSVQVVNSDRRFLTSNAEAALLQGDAAAGIPSITGIDGVPLAPNSASPDFAVNNVETVVVQGKQVTIEGTGFDTVNGLAVNLFCDCSGGKAGPFLLKPGTSGLTSTRIAFTLPVSGIGRQRPGPVRLSSATRAAMEASAAKATQCRSLSVRKSRLLQSSKTGVRSPRAGADSRL